MNKLLLILMIIFLSSCATTPKPDTADVMTPINLEFAGPHADDPAVIKFISNEAPTNYNIQLGDTITAFDDKKIPSVWSFYQSLNPRIKKFTVKTKNDELVEYPINKLIKDQSWTTYPWMFMPGETIQFDITNPYYKRTEIGALTYPGSSVAVVTANLWNRGQKFIELYIDYRNNQYCNDCKIDNIAVLDLGRNSWLSPVSNIDVAWSVYPAVGEAPRLINIPPPILIGGGSTTISQGTVRGNINGNQISGNYTGSSSTLIHPQYDYTLTAFALAHNIGATIKRNQIITSNNARRAFVSRRMSNLRFSTLNPGERISGMIYYHLPVGFDGPFRVVIKTKGLLGLAEFELPNN